MRKGSFRTRYLLFVATVLIAGCATSAPSHFYQLSPLEGREVAAEAGAHEGGSIVAVGPVRIPDYINRPEIVTRSGANELNLSEFDLWAGSLENDLIRVLVEDLSSLLPGNRYFVTRRTPGVEAQVPVLYRVEMSVERFDGSIGGTVSLWAKWMVVGKDRQMLKRESKISETVNGKGYDALVSAMSGTVGTLSREIAEAVLSLAPEGEQ